jgi:hypothetical protein
MKRPSFVRLSGWCFVLGGLMESCLGTYPPRCELFLLANVAGPAGTSPHPLRVDRRLSG